MRNPFALEDDLLHFVNSLRSFFSQIEVGRENELRFPSKSGGSIFRLERDRVKFFLLFDLS